MRAQVINLRRTHSIAQVAKLTGLPVGTVKTLVSRSGAFRDNPHHRALFTLPTIQPSKQTLPAVPELPPRQRVTGDDELDAVLWLRAVIDTGNPALIEKAMQAKERIKTPPKELEKRYTNHLVSENPGNWTVVFKTFGFADLDGLAQSAIERERLRAESAARFNDVFAMTDAENFCITAMHGLDRTGKFGDYDKTQVAERFRRHPEIMPHTLADCLHEMGYWDDLYRLRHAVERDSGDGPSEASARRWFTFGLMAEIRPRSREEAIAVFRYMSDEDMMDFEESNAIIENLIGGHRYGN